MDAMLRSWSPRARADPPPTPRRPRPRSYKWAPIKTRKIVYLPPHKRQPVVYDPNSHR